MYSASIKKEGKILPISIFMLVKPFATAAGPLKQCDSRYQTCSLVR